MTLEELGQGHMLGNAVGFTFASSSLLVGNKLCNKKGTLLHFMVGARARLSETCVGLRANGTDFHLTIMVLIFT